ncbi:hypothetical protein APHAL10511_000447 [Amanita phalloides]|nr:hypothetical protein APHAL10511_000447 [Amanita phalloides]
MSSSPTVSISLPLDPNGPPVSTGSDAPSQSPLKEKSVHGSIRFHRRLSVRKPQQQHQHRDLVDDDDDDNGHEDVGKSNDRTFSIVLPRGDSNNSLHAFKVKYGEEVHMCQTSQTSLEVPEKDMKALEADYIPDSGAKEDVYPDGGFQAWMVVLGGMLNTFST